MVALAGASTPSRSLPGCTPCDPITYSNISSRAFTVSSLALSAIISCLCDSDKLKHLSNSSRSFAKSTILLEKARSALYVALVFAAIFFRRHAADHAALYGALQVRISWILFSPSSALSHPIASTVLFSSATWPADFVFSASMLVSRRRVDTAKSARSLSLSA